MGAPRRYFTEEERKTAKRIRNASYRQGSRIGLGAGNVRRGTPPTPAQELDRDARERAPRTTTSLLCGDPAPGQSALDQKQKNGSHPS